MQYFVRREKWSGVCLIALGFGAAEMIKAS
jgi:hypothetical protein